MTTSDLRERAQLRTLRRNGNGSSNPIDEMYADSRKIVAAKMMQKATAETDVEAIRAENERIKAEIEREKLLAEAKAPLAQGDRWHDYIMAQLEKVQGQLVDTQAALSQTQTDALNQRMEMLAGELERVQSEKPVQRSLREQIDEARETLALVEPKVMPVPPTPANPHAFEIERLRTQSRAWEIRTQLSHEDKLRDDDRRHEIRLAEIEADKEVRLAEVRVKQEHQEKMDRFYSDYAPKVIDVISPILAHIAGGITNPAAAAPVMPQVAAPEIQVPAGFQSAPCQHCGATMIFNPAWGEALCQRCGTLHSEQASPPQGDQEQVRPEDDPLSEDNYNGVGL